jgi:hypothetical protein
MPSEPQTQTPESTPYELIGGEAAVRNLVKRFYDLMDDCGFHAQSGELAE